MKTAIVGGGAAGFFLAVNLKEMVPQMQVDIYERSHRVLAKVAVSGGGRCNITNSFSEVRDLSAVYPRGHRLMKRLFNVFDYRDAYRWFEAHGVPLVTQDDCCVFPQVQDSQAVIDCFLRLSHHHLINIYMGRCIHSLDDVAGYDFVAVTTGGITSSGEGLRWLSSLGHSIETPVPSLFSLRIDDPQLTSLQGLVMTDAVCFLPGTKLRAQGPLLITHWGISGPAVLKLSSYGARLLADGGYQSALGINWTGCTEADVQAALYAMSVRQPQKQLLTLNPFSIPQRLWVMLLRKALGDRCDIRWSELNKKDVNRMVNVLTNDGYQVTGRAPFKDEFVTCGGVSLKSINPSSLESRFVPRLYFAGEVLDIDGITGGFNFQAAWTTAYTVARSIASSCSLTSV